MFRHTYLSLLAASNVDPKTIQALAGHAGFSFTFNKYINSNRINMQNASIKFSNHIEKLTEKLTRQKTVEANTDKAQSIVLTALN